MTTTLTAFVGGILLLLIVVYAVGKIIGHPELASGLVKAIGRILWWIITGIDWCLRRLFGKKRSRRRRRRRNDEDDR